MHFECIIWDLDDDPIGNVQHMLNRHGITKGEFEEILRQLKDLEQSHNSDRLTGVGVLPDGRLIRIVLEQVDEGTIYPVTAFEIL